MGWKLRTLVSPAQFFFCETTPLSHYLQSIAINLIVVLRCGLNGLRVSLYQNNTGTRSAFLCNCSAFLQLIHMNGLEKRIAPNLMVLQYPGDLVPANREVRFENSGKCAFLHHVLV